MFQQKNKKTLPIILPETVIFRCGNWEFSVAIFGIGFCGFW
jgi:hypothetical protein